MPIDVHAHYVPHRILATLEERARDFGVSLVKTPPQCALHFDYGLKVRPFFAKLIEPVAQRLDGMSAQGVSCQLLSVWPDIFAYGLPSPIAARWHRLMNESLSELCHSYPGRFALFASVPLRHRLNQLCKKRADLQAIVEMQRALRRRLDQRYAKISGALFERRKNAVGNVMGVHIDRHEVNPAGKESSGR